MQGVLYDSRISKSRGEIVLTFRKLKLLWTVRTFGYAFVLASMAGILFIFQPIVNTELSFRLAFLFNSEEKERVRDKTEQEMIKRVRAEMIAQEEAREKEYARTLAQQFGITDTSFSLYIPKIGAKGKVIENVDPGNEKVYREALQKGVAHAEGSVFPGSAGASFLFAHSTDAPWNIAQYNAVFYLLRELQPQANDEIYLFFLDKVYKYKVSEKHIVEANDISWLTEAKEGPERLVLQTCWPPGTTWKRLIVVAKPSENGLLTN